MSQDLSKAKIYKITNDFNDEVYIGSTCDTLIKRFSYHKRGRNQTKWDNHPLFTLMRNIGTSRFAIYLIEDYPCLTKQELQQREGYWIRQMGTLNKRVEGRSSAEYYEEHRDKLLTNQKMYYQNNKETIKDYQKKYKEENKDIIKEKNKISYKAYYEKNKDAINEKNREYCRENKDKFSQKIVCICGKTLSFSNVARHNKSIFHRDYIQKQLLT